MLFSGGKRLAYEDEIPFRNLIVFDKGIPVHNDGPIELSPTTEPLSLKVKANGSWQSLTPLASVIEDHWYTYSFYAKISNMPGGVFLYTNTNQYGDQLGIVDLSSWELQVNSTRVSALREPNGFDLTNFIRQNNLQNVEMKISVTFRASKTGQTGFALESDATGFEFYTGLWKFQETPWCSAYEDYAMKSDLTTKTIIQDVDINTLTEEGGFFVKSNNLNNFPANYQNSWYFLNVESTIEHGDAGRIKQTVVPDDTNLHNWILVRSGLWHNDGSVSWCSWLILDFANGKILHSK